MLRHLPAEGDFIGELRFGQLAARRLDEQVCPLIEAVVHRHIQRHHAAHRHHLGGFQCAGRGGRIGPDEAAGPQQHAAEVSCDDHDEVGQSAVLQDLQGRRTRCFGRFAVVGIALPAPLPQAVGIDIVAGGAVGRAHLLEEGHGLLLAVCKGELRNEAALLLFVFSDGCSPDGAVILHAESSCCVSI